MKDAVCRFYDLVKNCLIRLTNNHKGWLISFGIVFLTAAITGIMTTINYLDIVTCDNLINKYLLELLAGERSYISLFLISCFWLLLTILFVIWFTKNIFFVVMDFLLLSVLSYIWGFDICIIVMTLGLAGVVYGVLVLGLIGIIIFSIIIYIFSIACKKFVTTKNTCPTELNRQYLVVFLCFTVVGILALFVMSLLFGSIRIFVIVE